MSTRVQIIDGPIPGMSLEAVSGAGGGAKLVFDGIVRAAEGERTVVALDYEAYEPMASRMLQRIGDMMIAKHGLIGLEVIHSRGRVPVGGVSLRVVIDAKHRGESLAAMAEFIDLLKLDVPIWKKPVWA